MSMEGIEQLIAQAKADMEILGRKAFKLGADSEVEYQKLDMQANYQKGYAEGWRGAKEDSAVKTGIELKYCDRHAALMYSGEGACWVYRERARLKNAINGAEVTCYPVRVVGGEVMK